MEPPQVELSRSFKRRQRRKKQLERRRQTDGAAGSSADEHEPIGTATGEPCTAATAVTATTATTATTTTATTESAGAAGAVSSAEQKQPGAPEGSEVSPAAKAASAAAGVVHKKSGRGRPRRNSRPEREKTESALVSAAAVPPESAARRNTESEPSEASKPQDEPPSEASKPQDEPPAEAAHRPADNTADSSQTASRPAKSGSAKRRKRKSTGPSSAVPDGQQTEPASSPGQRTEPAPSPPDASGSTEAAPVAAERVSPSAGVPRSEAECAGPEPVRRRDTSPVVSSTEEVLRSIRALQTVLGELRTGLLAAPPPARKAVTAPTSAPAPTPAPAPASAPAPAPAPIPAPAPAPAPAAACAPDTVMSPPSAAEPATGGGEAPQKTKEQIKAERKVKAEAAKLAKAAKASQKEQQQQTAPAAGDSSPASGAGGDKPLLTAAQSAGTAAEAPGKSAAGETGKPVTGEAAKPAAGEAGKPAAGEAGKPAAGEAGKPAAGEAGKPAAGEAGKPAAGEAGKPAAGEKSKAELKAERRAKQEAQRAAKAAAASAAKTGSAAASAPKPATPAKSAKSAALGRQTTPAAGLHQESAAKANRRSAKKTVEKTAARKGLQMFSHLLQFDASSVDALTVKSGVHPALVPFLLRLAGGRLAGSNAGAVALLTALADLVDQYVTPEQRELRRDLPDKVRREVARCRPLSVAMENVAHRLEQAIRDEVPADKGDYEAKQFVIQWIESYIQDNICKAMSAITQYAEKKIKDDDVILTYGRSTAVLDVLSSAQGHGRRFRVIVVDSRPRLEGRDMLQQLLDAGVPCSYGVITAISHHMKEATKVLLGAHALLSNGMVLSAAGTALVSLTGHALNRPVLVCCETYKFSDRVQTDSQVYNQLGNPDELVTSPDSPLADLRQSESLSLLNLIYDVTPPELVDVVITELGAIPCTSVPAVLRLQQAVLY